MPHMIRSWRYERRRCSDCKQSLPYIKSITRRCTRKTTCTDHVRLIYKRKSFRLPQRLESATSETAARISLGKQSNARNVFTTHKGNSFCSTLSTLNLILY